MGRICARAIRASAVVMSVALVALLFTAASAFAASTYFEQTPGVNAVNTTAMPLISVKVSDPVGISTGFQMKIDGVSRTPKVKWGPGNAWVQLYYQPTSPLANGSHTVYASVFTNAGRTSTTWSFSQQVQPTVGPMAPADGSTVDTQKPTISAVVNTNGGSLTSYTMTVDGLGVTPAYDAATKTVSYTPATRLANDRVHTASLTVVDSGGASTTVTWNFTVQIYASMVDTAGCTECHTTYPTAHPMSNCVACHEDNGPSPAYWNMEDLTPVHGADYLLGIDCAYCHTSMYPAVPRHPANIGDVHQTATNMSGCACHVADLTTEHNRYTTDSGGSITCASCHASTDPQVQAGMAAGTRMCPDCHTIPAGHPYAEIDHVADVGETADLSGKTCGSCHEMDLMAEHEKSSSASAGRGCVTCHGSPRDSFETWNQSCAQGGCHSGATAMHAGQSAAHQPSAAAADCQGSGCHSFTDVAALHAAASKVIAETTYTSCSVCHRAGATATKECATCHADRLEPHGYDVPMHTATDAASTACAGSGCHAGTEAMPLHSGGCATCHANPTKGDLTAGMTSFSCNGCHVTEGVDYHKGLSESHASATDCYGGCHSAQIESTAHVPSCATCHQSTAERVTGAIASENTDCSACHQAGNSYVDATGKAYVLVGAQHDGVQPAISNVVFNYTTNPAAPVISWTTDRPATTYVDYTGPDWSYDGMQFDGYTFTAGNATLSTSHSVSFPATSYSSSSGYFYCYRIRTVDAQGRVATSPMRIYHRNRSSNTNYVPGSNEPDYASLNTDSLKLSAIQQNGSRVAKVANAGWESQSLSSALPTPASPGTAATQAQLDAGANSAGWWRTKLTTTDKAFNWQLTRYQFAAGEFESAQGFEVGWSGYAENSTGHPVVTYLWNFDTGKWDRVDSRDAGGGRSIKVVESTDAEQSYCLRCHSTPVSSAVTMPSGLTNMRVGWNTDYHGAGVGAGYGGTLKAPYARGQAALACDTCHESSAHGGSANPYKLKATVNGSAVSVTSGTQAGSLCSACHEGTVNDFHAKCITCHADPAAAGINMSYHNATGQAPTNFTGKDCLECHKHGKTGYSPGCHSCHNETGVGYWTTF